jgi:ketosteroid isomerase-like protein
MKRLACFLLLLSGACSAPDNGNVATARKLFDAFNRHAWTEMASYYDESAQFLDPSFGPDYVTKTRSETVAKYEGFQQAFPDIHDEVTGIYPSGDKVIVEFVSTGKSGDSLSFRLPIISVLTFRNSKIVKDATYYDQQ